MYYWSVLSYIYSRYQPYNVQLECSIGHRVRIPAVRCPIGAFYRTSSQDSSRAMSNWSALSDIESGFQPCDVQLGRSIGHRGRISSVRCPIWEFHTTSDDAFSLSYCKYGT